MKKQEIVSKDFAELAKKPIQSDLAREFSEEELEAMAREDGTDDDFNGAKFLGIEELATLVQPKKPKELISIRLDADVLAWYRSYGRGYQSFIGDLLTAFKQSQKEPPRPGNTPRITARDTTRAKPRSGKAANG